MVNIFDNFELLAKIIAGAVSILGAILTLYSSRERKIKSDEIQEMISKSNLNEEQKNIIYSKIEKQRKYSKTFAILFVLVLIVSIISFFVSTNYWEAQNYNIKNIQELLAIKDSKLFNNSSAENYEYARVIPDQSALESETNLGETLKHTNESFSILTISGAFTARFSEDIKNCVKRGVKVRMLLVDSSYKSYYITNNHLFYVNNYSTMKKNIEETKNQLEKTLNLAKEINELVKLGETKGSIEVRLFQEPLYYNMWIKDPVSDQSLEHINILSYRKGIFQPFFRITKESSKRLFESIKKEFEAKWTLAKGNEVQL